MSLKEIQVEEETLNRVLIRSLTYTTVLENCRRFTRGHANPICYGPLGAVSQEEKLPLGIPSFPQIWYLSLQSKVASWASLCVDLHVFVGQLVLNRWHGVMESVPRTDA